MSADFEVPLIPVRGDGRLTAWDVDLAAEDLPRGVEVLVVVDEADDFEADAPGRLARLLFGNVVRHRFRPHARTIAADWTALYEHAAADILAVEARLLGRGA